jgi:tripartite-type tricarboxylate transporter receptor subunit TctC
MRTGSAAAKRCKSLVGKLPGWARAGPGPMESFWVNSRDKDVRKGEIRMKIGRGIVTVASLALAGACFAQGSATYPTRPVRMVVSFPPGGGADLTARTVAQKLTESFGQPVVVDNRPGANGLLGTDIVAKSDPDGYTILLTDRGALGINPSLYKKLPYDPLKDLAYIGIACTGSYVLAINSKLPATTFQEFIALAKAKPGAMNYGSFGIGSMAQMNMEALNQRMGIRLTHVPYKGGGPAVRAAVSGEVGAVLVTPPSIIGHIREGRLRALVIGDDKRSPLLPDVPTMAEVGGGADTFVPTYFGFAAPAGTPAAIVEKLSAEIKRAVNDPELAKRLAGTGLDAYGSTPDEMAATVKGDVARFGKLVKSIGIEPE